MTKKGATILALLTTLFYFIVSIVVMLVYKGDSGVTATNNQFLIFLLVQAPRIIFLFGLTVFLLVLSALPIEKKKRTSTTSATNSRSTKTAQATTASKPAAQTKRVAKPVIKKVVDTEKTGE